VFSLPADTMHLFHNRRHCGNLLRCAKPITWLKEVDSPWGWWKARLKKPRLWKRHQLMPMIAHGGSWLSACYRSSFLYLALIKFHLAWVTNPSSTRSSLASRTLQCIGVATLLDPLFVKSQCRKRPQRYFALTPLLDNNFYTQVF
jgi:hypothetical protein